MQYQDTRPHRPRKRKQLGVLLFVLALVLTGSFWIRSTQRHQKPYVEPARVFDGDSELLKESIVIPTLDTPLPAGKNVIWCASFELAWNRLKSDVVKGPVGVAGAEELAARLNAAVASESDLSPESCFATAGWAKDGIGERIRREFAARFPGEPLPEIDPQAVLVAYAYLKAAARFTIPFFDNPAEFAFVDGAGRRTAVSSFGIRIRLDDSVADDRIRKQVEVLYVKRSASLDDDYAKGRIVPAEFALDPCRTTSPYQIVFAVVPQQDTLAATLADVVSKIERWSPGHAVEFGSLDVLLVPNMAWKITHHFCELEGRERKLLNPGFEGLWIEAALQTIEFKLDRSGAELASESGVAIAAIPTDYVFDRPFLVYMKKRDAAQPFFVMWVDNAELLCKPQSGAQGPPAAPGERDTENARTGFGRAGSTLRDPQGQHRFAAL